MPRVTGLATGIDTRSLIEQTLEAARKPRLALAQRRDLLTFRKQVYARLKTDLQTLRQRLFTLRLQETFLSKKVESGAPTSLTATATPAAAVGSHQVKVTQLARPAVASSHFTNLALVSSPPNTAGLVSVSGRPVDNLSGVWEVTVADSSASQLRGAPAEDAAGNNPPTIAQGFTNSGSDRVRLTVNGVTQDVLVTSWAAGATLQSVAAQLESDINSAFGDTVVQVTSTASAGGGNDRIVISDALRGRANAITIDYGATQSLGGSAGANRFGPGKCHWRRPSPAGRGYLRG